MTNCVQSLQLKLRPEHILAARRELAKRSLCDFACLIDIPTVPVTDEDDEDQFSVIRLNTLAAHHSLILRKLQGVESGEVPNLMLLLPPGSAKSTYTDVVFIPWFMSRKPRRNVILASYASDIAKKQGRRARQLIQSRSFQNLMDVSIKDDQKAADEWALTNGSEYMAGGLLSGLTGNRAALGVLDDPIRGREAAESETIRQKTWDAYIDDFCSRLIPGAPQVMILTRWHQDDPAGRILPETWDGESGVFSGRDGRVWHVICLPAIADRVDDPLGRKIGQTLWPEWFSLDHWKPFQLNRRTWSSLYQQKPSPDEGSYFKLEWFKRYKEIPKDIHTYLTSDHAPGGTEDNDYTCVRPWGYAGDGNLYLLPGGFRTQETLDKSMTKVIGKSGLIKRYKPLCWFPEDDNNWKSIDGFVRKAMQAEGNFCRIEPISPHGGDKEVKAQPFQAMASMGMIYIPEGPEGDDIIDQYIKFPAGKNDDEICSASIIGRAIDMAHPAIAKKIEKRQNTDRWDKAFKEGRSDKSWKTV